MADLGPGRSHDGAPADARPAEVVRGAGPTRGRRFAVRVRTYHRAMPTRIHFIGGQRLVVQTEPDGLLEALDIESSAPIGMTDDDGDAVYVNPAAITYWKAYERQPPTVDLIG